MALGHEALPAIFDYLKTEQRGMNIMLLLWDILKTSPYQPDTESTPGLVLRSLRYGDYSVTRVPIRY